MAPWAALLLGVSVAVSALVWRHRSSIRQPPASPGSPLPSRGAAAVRAPELKDDGWTGSRKCAECHREIWESYQLQPMAQSATTVLEAAVVEDYTQNTSFSSPESRTYRVERTPEHIWHHESMTDADGGVVYDQAVEIRYAIGSGKRGRSYLIDRGGMFKVSPIAWYTKVQRWDLSPGYQPRLHQRFDRRAIDGCLVCHVSRLSYERDKPNRYREPPILEAAIGCERCHGPGGKHVRRHESADAGDDGTDPIVNPARLEPGAREDVCNQCHLIGERILRNDRTEHDFRPGQRLEDNWTVFLKEHVVDSDGMTRAVGQVDQMRESTCFRQSAGRLGCVTCHDPHSSPTPELREAFYDNRCAACHADKGCALAAAERSAPPASSSCIACHMPPLPANNVPHTSQTDHRILRRPAASASSTIAGAMELFDNAESRLPRVDQERARGLLQARKMLHHPDAVSAARLEAKLLPVLQRYPDDTEILLILGSLSMAQGRTEAAREFWLTVLRLRPEHEEALRYMVQVEKDLENVSAAIAYMERYQAIDPWQADSFGFLAQLLWNAGRREEAIDAARKGIKLDPRLVPLRRWLAGIFRQLGRIDESAEQDQMIQRMQGR
jgi:predicted CXXCH cytochrome family protein